jgi:hypothetical protein
MTVREGHAIAHAVKNQLLNSSSRRIVASHYSSLADCGSSSRCNCDAWAIRLFHHEGPVFTGRFIVRAIIGAAKARRRILFVFLALAAATGLHAQDNPPGRLGRISYLKGKVSFLPAGQDQWSEATLNYVVTTGDHIYTDHGAKAEIEVGPYTV